MATEKQSMTRSERIAELDVNDLLPKCLKKKTVTKADFVDHMKDRHIPKLPKLFRVQTDPAIITGHHANNLKVNNIQMKTRTWPYAMDWREEYRQFLMRTKWCNEEIYKLFFEYPPVRFDQVEEFLNDLRRTVYGSDYSANEYASLRSQRTIKLDDKYPYESKDILTTYGNYYNRVEELNSMGALNYLRPKPINLSKEIFANNMRKLFRKYDLSTYFEEICLPALVAAKDGKMPAVPIDRYTNRRY